MIHIKNGVQFLYAVFFAKRGCAEAVRAGK